MRSLRGKVGTAALAAVLVGGTLTGLLSAAAVYADHRDEQRLVKIQVEQGTAVLQAALAGVQTPLAGAAQVAASISNGSASAFVTYMTDYVGKGKTFAGATLWRVTSGVPRLVGRVGSVSLTKLTPARVNIISRAAKRPAALAVAGPVGTLAQSVIMYAYAAKSTAASYVVYAETAPPLGKHSSIAAQPPFAQLRYAIYLGTEQSSANLLATNAEHLPISGRKASARVTWGTSQLTLVASAKGHLGGGVAQALWWIILIVGAVVTVLAALAAQRLARGGRTAQELTGTVGRMRAEQRSITGAVQQSLLPRTLPLIRGIDTVARYVPGAEGPDSGGDWYDVMAFEDGTFFFVIGDVSGQGLDAGTTMAALRFAVRAYAAERIAPDVVLDRLRALPEVTEPSQFATVVCGTGDPRTNRVVLASAGHLAPLLITGGSAQFVEVDVSPPIGVGAGTSGTPSIVDVAPGSTLLLYTNGLVERRSETIREGLDRLRITAAQIKNDSLNGFVDDLLRLMRNGGTDDVAALALRWTGQS